MPFLNTTTKPNLSGVICHFPKSLASYANNRTITRARNPRRRRNSTKSNRIPSLFCSFAEVTASPGASTPHRGSRLYYSASPFAVLPVFLTSASHRNLMTREVGRVLGVRMARDEDSRGNKMFPVRGGGKKRKARGVRPTFIKFVKNGGAISREGKGGGQFMKVLIDGRRRLYFYKKIEWNILQVQEEICWFQGSKCT